MNEKLKEGNIIYLTTLNEQGIKGNQRKTSQLHLNAKWKFNTQHAN